MENAGDIVDCHTGYSGEVIYALVRVFPKNYLTEETQHGDSFYHKSKETVGFIQSQLKKLSSDQKKNSYMGWHRKGSSFYESI